NGVPDFIKNSLFNPFITSKNNGSGLGLTQVIGAMNAHSGKVEYVHSNSETTFRLSFPEKNVIK
ncbi:MAG: two-component sensor histidine kinase, partial [Candidatus Puniceispirillales bacterium]